ncbi:cysteine desulfurase NifS [Candidatus Parcubacteria bacterium]|nr:MAG: cysteine desulfurase NifS [Candidatus Parcubacteria bacterium]
MRKVYFDHSATTPVDKKVLEAMMPYFSDTYGNATSIHSFGLDAAKGLDIARTQMAKFLNCSETEVIFTSGATESDNLAIKGFIKAIKKQGIKNPHVITSIVEHDAVLEPFMELEAEGVEVDHVKVLPNGVVDVEDFKKKLKDNTVLVSIMHVNSEVGAVMPIREIGKTIKKHNESREREWKKLSVKERGERPQKAYFHVDATQGVNFFKQDVKWNYVDMLSMSGHKIYGPKGVGALYCQKDVPMESLQRGGHQEWNKRSGTINVTGIVGLGAAVEQLDEKTLEKDNKKIAKLRDKLVDGVLEKIPDVVLNTDRENATPAHAHFSFKGCEGEAVLMSLDIEGIAVSTGSACASGSLKASHVLIAMGIKKEIAHNSIRFSLGKHNTEEEIEYLLEKLPPIIEKIRKMNPIYNT